MSQENVETVRGMYDTFADGGLDAMAEFWDPNINHRAAEGAVDDVGEMDGLAFHPEDLLDVGDDRVIAAVHMSGRAKLSGAETELRVAVVYTVRDGKIVRGREYLNLEDALAAVGLRE
jgi:ketosteroid isomerase-like protein